MPAKEIVLDENGEPLDYFVFSVTEKIGISNYQGPRGSSSIDIFTSLGRNIPNTPEARQEVIEVVEEVLGKERELIKENLGLA